MYHISKNMLIINDFPEVSSTITGVGPILEPSSYLICSSTVWCWSWSVRWASACRWRAAWRGTRAGRAGCRGSSRRSRASPPGPLRSSATRGCCWAAARRWCRAGDRAWGAYSPASCATRQWAASGRRTPTTRTYFQLVWLIFVN